MSTNFLKPEHLSPLSGLSLRAKHIVEGLIAGMHRSPYHGFSSEFLEFRPYREGEPASKIDWRKYAKTEKNFVRLFEDETNLYAHILLDKSASMKFASAKNWTKYEFARTLAAALSWILIRQRDAVGLALFSSSVESMIKPGSTNIKLKEIISTLEGAEPSDTTNCSPAINRVASTLKKRGMTIIISDLMDDAEELIKSLKHLKFNGQDILLIRILDPMEMNFVTKNDLDVIDLETAAHLKIDSKTAMESFLIGFNEHQDTINKGCRELAIDYLTLSTKSPFAEALLKVVEKRNRKF